MKYPESLVKRIREEFSEKHLLFALDQQNTRFVSVFLEDNCQDGFDLLAEKVLVALNEGDLLIIREAAEKAIRRKKLYEDWLKYLQE